MLSYGCKGKPVYMKQHRQKCDDIHWFAPPCRACQDNWGQKQLSVENTQYACDLHLLQDHGELITQRRSKRGRDPSTHHSEADERIQQISSSFL